MSAWSHCRNTALVLATLSLAACSDDTSSAGSSADGGGGAAGTGGGGSQAGSAGVGGQSAGGSAGQGGGGGVGAAAGTGGTAGAGGSSGGTAGAGGSSGGTAGAGGSSGSGGLGGVDGGPDAGGAGGTVDAGSDGAPDAGDGAVSRLAANGCTYETATDMTGQSTVNLPTWTFGYQVCTIVDAGTTVVWSGNFSVHPLAGGVVPTNDTTSLISTSNQSGATASVTFNQAGDYPYFCTIHLSSMEGVIYVN